MVASQSDPSSSAVGTGRASRARSHSLCSATAARNGRPCVLSHASRGWCSITKAASSTRTRSSTAGFVALLPLLLPRRLFFGCILLFTCSSSSCENAWPQSSVWRMCVPTSTPWGSRMRTPDTTADTASTGTMTAGVLSAGMPARWRALCSSTGSPENGIPACPLRPCSGTPFDRNPAASGVPVGVSPSKPSCTLSESSGSSRSPSNPTPERGGVPARPPLAPKAPLAADAAVTRDGVDVSKGPGARTSSCARSSKSFATGLPLSDTETAATSPARVPSL
mmetsp:Transcript_11025/g.33039  ORF Transcript_11025/g.33039 Transcript_11025/m.33039 type:complete len:280 (-) Transcript_11025:3909-4748(-)